MFILHPHLSLQIQLHLIGPLAEIGAVNAISRPVVLRLRLTAVIDDRGGKDQLRLSAFLAGAVPLRTVDGADGPKYLLCQRRPGRHKIADVILDQLRLHQDQHVIHKVNRQNLGVC